MKTTVASLIKLTIAAAALAAFGVAPAGATPGYADHIEYYSDDTYSVLVGEAGDNCDGQTYQSGEVTPYKLHFLAPCNDPGGPIFP